MNNCPFKTGDRIFRKDDGAIGKVIEVTERGFKYELDKPKVMIARWGMVELSGETFCDLGYGDIRWELYDGKNKIEPLKVTYHSAPN
jgi:hypothetical protein